MSRRTMRTEPVATTESGHLTEFLYDDGESDDLLVCGAHGGDVEPGSAELAVELATDLRDASCWACFGHDADVGAFEAWHPPSKAISPEEYALLAAVADRGFETVFSLHGLGDDEVIVGGATDAETKERLRRRLDSALSLPVRVASAGPYAGVHPENFVNWLAADGGGLQVELGSRARGAEADRTREALRGFLQDEL